MPPAVHDTHIYTPPGLPAQESAIDPSATEAWGGGGGRGFGVSVSSRRQALVHPVTCHSELQSCT